MRTTESHHAAIKNKLRDGPHHAALFTFYFSLFTSAGLTFHFALFTFHFKRRNSPFDSLLLPYITPIQCSTYGARMAVKIPLRVRPSEA